MRPDTSKILVNHWLTQLQIRGADQLQPMRYQDVH